MTNLELLAPAKNIEIGFAAINCGADAVYIGAQKFGARSSAGNSIEDIAKLVKYAHQFNSKVYVTLNTLLSDKDIDEAVPLIDEIYNSGADALIIQDTGILEISLPPIVIHASTQMHNFSADQVNFWEKTGISRVVLARELSIDEISEIKSKCNIELEAFIHGSLCVCYSGRCFMSKAITGRSGNKGECSQPCRSYYNLLNADKETIIKHKHLLSLKDLNLTNYIKALADAGVISFKIEGRLKDANYVKNIVGHYRIVMDGILNGTDFKKSSSGKTYLNFQPDPERTFNRMYTDYFIGNRHNGNISPYTQKSMGKYIGNVKQVKPNCLIVENGELLNHGDGICYFDRYKVLKGFYVNNKDGDKIYIDNTDLIEKDCKLFRNYDSAFEKLLSNPSYAKRKIGISVLFYEYNDSFVLEVCDEDNISVKMETILAHSKAENIELAKKNLTSMLSKTGDTIFEISKLSINTKFTYIFRNADINAFRRDVLQLLVDKRIKQYKKTEQLFIANDKPFFTNKITKYDNVTNEKAVAFYKRHQVNEIEQGIDAGNNPERLMITKHCLKFELGLCHKLTGNSILKIDSLKAIEPFYLQDKDNLYKLKFDCKNCVMELYSTEI